MEMERAAQTTPEPLDEEDHQYLSGLAAVAPEAPLELVSSKSIKEAGFKGPGQDPTRNEYHNWFQRAEGSGADAGGQGLKEAFAAFEDNWYIATALTMTVGFAMILFKPKGPHPGSLADEVAMFLYVVLVLMGTVNSTLGVWWAGHMASQVHWHPAAHFSKFWFASMNTTMGHAQQFAKVSIQQLVPALVPLCYLNFGYSGLALALLSIVYLHLQIMTWKKLTGRMRETYKEAILTKTPVIDDVTEVFTCCKAPFMEGLLGLLALQLVHTWCFSLRWASTHKSKFHSCDRTTGDSPSPLNHASKDNESPTEQKQLASFLEGCGISAFDQVVQQLRVYELLQGVGESGILAIPKVAFGDKIRIRNMRAGGSSR